METRNAGTESHGSGDIELIVVRGRVARRVAVDLDVEVATRVVYVARVEDAGAVAGSDGAGRDADAASDRA